MELQAKTWLENSYTSRGSHDYRRRTSTIYYRFK